MKKLFVLLAAALLSSCTTTPKFPDAKTLGETQGSTQTIAILGINDLHGALVERTLRTREAQGVDPVTYRAGGAPVLAAHVQLLRSVFKSNLFVFDAGDEFQGTIESNLQRGAPVVQFYNAIGLNAAAIGNHEFDFGPAEGGDPKDLQGTLKQRISEAHYPYLSANVVEKATGHRLPGALPHVMLTSGNLKVGVIGLTTAEALNRTRPEFVTNLAIQDLKETALRESRELRKEGANIVILVAHAGLHCDMGHALPGGPYMTTPITEAGECGPNDEIVRLLKALPPGTLDAVVAGHTHQIVHQWVHDVPVIEGGASGLNYNLIYLTYDWNQGKIVTDRTRIEGPVPVCPKVFENQGDCDGNRPAPTKGRGSLSTPVFHGARIYPDSAVAQLLEPSLEKSEQAKKRIVGKAAKPLEHSARKESELGNLVTDAIRAKSKADVALVNAGQIRAAIEEGPITYEALFRTLPYEDTIRVMTVTGKELKSILAAAENGMRGLFPVSGVRLRVVGLDYGTDKRFIDAKLADGSTIREQKNYTLAMPSFLLMGGDDMESVMTRLHHKAVKASSYGLMRDAVLEYLAQVSPVNSDQHPLVDPSQPRIKQERPVERPRKRRHR